VALRANRGWPLFVSAAQVLIVTGHLAKVWDVAVVRTAYWAVTQVPFLFQLAVLAAGTLAHMARRRHIGRYHSWRPPTPPACQGGLRHDRSLHHFGTAQGSGHPRR